MIVDYGKKFIKDFDKLPVKLQKKFRERLILFLENQNHPLLKNHILTGELGSLRSINVTGDVRVLYQEVEKDRVVFLAIGTHSQLYK